MRRKTLFRGLFVIFLALITLRIVEVVRADSFEDYVDKVVPNGKMVINSVEPTLISEAFSYITYNLKSAVKNEYSNYGYSGISKDTTNNTNVEGIYEITFCEYRVSNGIKVCDQNQRVVNVEVTFDDSKKDNTIQERVSNYIENFEKGKQYHIWNNDPYEILIQIEDMELLSYLSKFDDGYNALMDLNGIFGLLHYNSTFRNITQNMNFAHSWNAAGNGCDINTSLRSDLLFEYDGFIYGRANSYIREFILNAIYIDENVENDNNSIMSAVQKRLDDNLGKNVATISLGDNTYLNSMIDEVIEDYATPYGIQIDKTKMVNQLFNISIGGYDYKFIVIKDSSKIKNLSNVKTVDFKTMSSIVFNSKYILADALIDIVKNDDNSTILNTLKLDSGITYDIGLFSQVLRSNIDKLDTGKFVVSVPISNQMLSKKLYAYYIKKDGSIEKHDVTIKDGFAEFETDHFSTYTIGESNEAKLKINSVKQEDNELQFENGKYVVEDYYNVIVDYELSNLDNSKEYTIKYVAADGSGAGFTHDESNSGIYLNVSNSQKKYTIKVCDTYECDVLYDEVEIEFDFKPYEVINNSKLYVKKVIQYNNEIVGVKDQQRITYNFNRYQVIKIELQSENFIDDMIYVIENYEFTGEELNDGVTITILPNEIYFYSLSVSRKGRYGIAIMNATSEDGYVFNAEYDYNINLTDFTYHLGYYDYPKIEVEEEESYSNYKLYALNSNYFNKDHFLKIDFKKDIADESQYYPLKIKITGNNKVYYDTEMEVRGDLVKNGDFISPKNVQLDLIKTEMDNDVYYNLYIELDGIGHNVKLIYNSVGKKVVITEKLYYENGKKSLTTAKGRGGSNWGAGVYPAYNSLFRKYPKIYLRFTSDNCFDNNMLYDYTLEYGKYTNVYDNNEAYTIVKQLKSGKVKGSVLNTIGAFFEVNNQDNYEMPLYKFTVKNGDELLYSSTPIIELGDVPSLSSVTLKANNRNLFLKKDNYMIDSYVATRNAPIDMKISGLGFEDDKEYTLNITYYLYSNGSHFSGSESTKDIHKEVTVLGRDLNNNGVKIVGNDLVIDKEYTYCFAYITIPGTWLQGGVDIDFVDSKDLFTSLNRYTLVNTEDVIKHISKLTRIDDFISNFNVADNGKMKVFDKTGENEITDKVGTGMLARVINKYDENLLDIDVVVTGDISGDGNISVTDLAKIERYLAKLGDLDGVYKMAADVNGNDSVTLTDLVKISRDIARLEEIK